MQKLPAEQYLSIGEASEYLGVSIDTLRRWTKKAKLTAFVSPGKHRYFKTSDLDKVFGTRYERKNDPVTPPGPTTPTLQPTANLPAQAGNLRLPKDNSPAYSAPENDFIHPIETTTVNEAQVPVIREERKPLEVPRYIRSNNISKYDLLLHLKGATATNSENKLPPSIVEVVRPVTIDIPKLRSILDPSPVERASVAREGVVSEIKPKEEPKSRLIVEEVMEVEKEIKKSGNQKIDKILKNAFLGFLALDVVLFFFWFLNYRINSPLP